MDTSVFTSETTQSHLSGTQSPQELGFKFTCYPDGAERQHFERSLTSEKVTQGQGIETCFLPCSRFPLLQPQLVLLLMMSLRTSQGSQAVQQQPLHVMPNHSVSKSGSQMNFYCLLFSHLVASCYSHSKHSKKLWLYSVLITIWKVVPFRLTEYKFEVCQTSLGKLYLYYQHFPYE